MRTSGVRGERAVRQAATAVERGLREAVESGDRAGYLRVLADADLFLYLPKYAVDAGTSAQWSTCEDAGGHRCVAVRTVGERLPRRARLVASRTSLKHLAYAWPDARCSLLVNPGTPSEMRLPTGLWARRRWKKEVARLPERQARPTRLLTTSAGPSSGPLAHALACGAHLSVSNGVLWNEMGDVYDEYEQDVALLRDWWSTTTPQDWQQQIDALLEAVNSPAEPEFVLGVRRELARETGESVDAATWRRTCSGILADMDMYDGTDQRLQKIIGRILRYEARFKADGVLPPDGVVRSAVGYDYGRAVSFARWGLSARLCPEDAATRAVLRAGAQSRERYDSWAEFSAGYVLGRVLRFDTETFGTWYEGVLSAHRLLMSDPESPWLTLPWRE